eukprot:3307040-Pleurochrysis_carterae.AAC.2
MEATLYLPFYFGFDPCLKLHPNICVISSSRAVARSRRQGICRGAPACGNRCYVLRRVLQTAKSAWRRDLNRASSATRVLAAEVPSAQRLRHERGGDIMTPPHLPTHLSRSLIETDFGRFSPRRPGFLRLLGYA